MTPIGNTSIIEKQLFINFIINQILTVSMNRLFPINAVAAVVAAAIKYVDVIDQ